MQKRVFAIHTCLPQHNVLIGANAVVICDVPDNSIAVQQVTIGTRDARGPKSSRVRHLHALFGTNSAEVAMLAHALGGPPWSFTVHGPEEFDKPQFIGLLKKSDVLRSL